VPDGTVERLRSVYLSRNSLVALALADLRGARQVALADVPFLRPIALVLAVRVRRADSGLGQAGPASVTITLDRYGHLLPGDVDTTLAQFDAYLARALNA